MSASTKLSTAVKAICFLTRVYPKPKTSSEISDYVGVNASKIRKILSMLVKNNIVESTYGPAGGFLIKKKPDEIHLQEIYCAIEDRKAFHLDVTKKNGGGLNNNSNLNFFFLDLFAEIQIDIEDKMKQISIQSILNKINS